MKIRTAAIFSYTLLLSAVILFSNACVTLVSETTPSGPADTDERMEKIGTVEVESTNWNWFFRQSAEERIALLEKLAKEKAALQFGDDVIVRTENTEGRWSPASLLMLFNSLGFVEEAALEASVWRFQPEAESPVFNYGIRYVVIPEQNYTSPAEFMIVEYKTREQLNEELLEACKSGRLAEKDLPRKQEQLPDEGKIFITLGREDITNAISRWFTFTCTYNDRIIFRKRGIEDIPYVYGTDKLWWNDMIYDIDSEWDGELKLTAEDSYQNKIYNFRIVKEIYEIPQE